MSTVSFDPLKCVETLESTGVATKGDIALLRKEIETQTNKIIAQVGGLFIAILGAIEIINRVWPVQ